MEKNKDMAHGKSIPADILKAFNKSRSGWGHRHLCNAIFNNVFLAIDGTVRPCCLNQKYILGDYRLQSLDEIWKGEAVAEFRKLILHDLFPAGCEGCMETVISGNHHSVQIRQYDNYSSKGKQIQRVEFQTGNICNLACDMCSGMLSSAVAVKKEHYTNNVNNSISLSEQSFIDVLSGLKEAQFSGGEPFLIPFYADVWKFLTEKNPGCTIIIQTNGTVLNTEIKQIVEKGNFHINISIDSLTPGRYEEIRINARLEKLMENIAYFRHYMDTRERTISVAVCLMPCNYTEIPDIVDYCNSNGMEIIFNTVSFPARNALWILSSEEIEEILSYFLSNSPESHTKTGKTNLAAYREQIAYVRQLLEKVRFFEQGRSLAADKEQTKELSEKVIRKLMDAALKRNRSDDPFYIEMIEGFSEMIKQEPDTERKLIGLNVMNRYDDSLLLSNLLREDKESLKKILTRLSLLADIK